MTLERAWRVRYRAPMRIAYHVMSSPLGLLFLAGGESGLMHVEYMDRKSIKRMIAGRADKYPGATWEPSLLDLKDAVDQLEGYFCGALTRFDLELSPTGTDFQRLVWKELLKIPFGETRTYGQIAKAIKQPKSARAVGLANNQNPLAIVVPCHRVIGANKSLTGYGGGVQRKRWLLEHEARFAKQGETDADLFTAASARTGTKRDSR
jgi:methylated-DNA-[protein]-cysteine S-methyltransferase